MSDVSNVRKLALPEWLDTKSRRAEKLKTIEQEILTAVEEDRNNQPHNYAPMTDPERMQSVAKLAGQTIREAYSATADKIAEANNEIIRMVAIIKHDGDDAIEQLKKIGEDHASRVEGALSHLHGMLVRLSDERKLLQPERPPTIPPQLPES